MKKVLLFMFAGLLVCVACDEFNRGNGTNSSYTTESTAGTMQSVQQPAPPNVRTSQGVSYHESNGPSQSMAGKKKYDMFKALVVSPEASFDDFVIVGYTQENTSMYEMSVYRNDQWVREHFLNEYGNFDESTFSRAYYVAKDYYKALGTANRDEIMESKRTYHRSNPDVPFEKRRKGPDF